MTNAILILPKNYIWIGALRYVFAVLVATLTTAIITLGLGAAYGVRLAQAPLDPFDVEYRGGHKYSTT